MGVISVASNASAWRGYEYYKNQKIISWRKVSDNEYQGKVKGSNDSYHVFLDTNHVRKSTCDCPHANGRRIICKHIVALFFEIFPKEADKYLRLIEESEKAAEEYEREVEIKLQKYLNSLSKEELKQDLLDILYDAPEWVYDRFVRDRIGY